MKKIDFYLSISRYFHLRLCYRLLVALIRLTIRGFRRRLDSIHLLVVVVVVVVVLGEQKAARKRKKSFVQPAGVMLLLCNIMNDFIMMTTLASIIAIRQKMHDDGDCQSTTLVTSIIQ